MEEIKQSKTLISERKVVQWTPVVIGHRFPVTVSKIKVEYKTGDFLNTRSIPKVVSELEGGLIIKMPLIAIEEELKNAAMQLQFLQSDDELVLYLEDLL